MGKAGEEGTCASCDAHYRVRAPSLHLRFHPSVLTFIDSHMITCWVTTCSVKIEVTTITTSEITFNWQLCLRAKEETDLFKFKTLHGSLVTVILKF